MQLTATCKQIEIGSGFREHIEASLGAILKKRFKTAIEAEVMFTKEAGLRRVEIALPTVRGIVVRASAAVPRITDSRHPPNRRRKGPR